MGLRVTGAKPTQDISQLKAGAGFTRRWGQVSLAGLRDTHRLLHESLEIGRLEAEQIEWTLDLHQMAAADMDILQGGLDGAMAQQELNRVRIDARVKQMGGKGVAARFDIMLHLMNIC